MADNDLVLREGFWVRADNMDQDLVIVRDIYLEDSYRTSLLSNADHEEVVIDVGAHIGTFAKLWHAKNPHAKIVCVEANPENMAALRKNVGDFAVVMHAACSYAKEPLALLNSIRPNCESTGGSIVVPASQIGVAPGQAGYQYWHDLRPLFAVTLEDVLAQIGADHIDVLKLDCEGSEYDILQHTTLRSHIRMIVGEYHGSSRWEEFRRRVFCQWSYGHMYSGGEAGGIFHLACRCWPPTPETSLRRLIVANADPADRYLLESTAPVYDALRDVTRRLQPSAICEVGVGSGYSALAFFEGGAAKVVGIDNDSDPETWRTQHARAILADRDFELMRVSSHDLPEFPPSDLIFLDGDRSFAGLCSDLDKASRSAKAILVDDYGDGNEVPVAITRFLARNHTWSLETIDFGDRVRKLALLQLRARQVLRLAVPPGIGDALWSLLKVPALLAAEGAESCDIDVCGSLHPRSADFLARFDFVRKTNYTTFECIEMDDPITPDGCFRWAGTGKGWHDVYDWILVPNGHLERGGRLEDWLPQYEIDWNIAAHYRVFPEDQEAVDALVAEVGPRFALFFASSLSGNTSQGHNRGPLWRPEDWAELARLFLLDGVIPIVIGAAWDRSYYDDVLKPIFPRGVLNRIDCWPIGATFAVMRRARCLVAFQSGLGIFGVYLGCNVAMWWRPHGDSLLADRYLSFREEMATAWAPPGAVESGRYLPLIYTRCSPASIYVHAKEYWLKDYVLCNKRQSAPGLKLGGQ